MTNRNINNDNNNNCNNEDEDEQQPQIVNTAFAMIVPGSELNTECIQLSNDKYVMQMQNPGLVQSFALSLLNVSELPSNVGFSVCYSLPPFEEFNYIGVMYGANPSKIFQCPWKDIKGITKCEMIRIGFELKSIDFLQSLEMEEDKNLQQSKNMLTVIKTEFAMKVAQNLYDWMSSYTKTTEDGEFLIAPQNCLDKWLQKFRRKYILDETFMQTG